MAKTFFKEDQVALKIKTKTVIHTMNYWHKMSPLSYLYSIHEFISPTPSEKSDANCLEPYVSKAAVTSFSKSIPLPVGFL